MKRAFFTWIIAVFTTTSAFAYLPELSEPYLGLLGGANFIDYDHHDITLNTQNGYLLGAFGGVRYDNNLRLEIELAYRRNNLKSVSDGTTSLPVSGRIELSTAMVNALYEFPLCCFSPCQSYLTPYVGLGLGYGRIDELGQSLAAGVNVSDNIFVWQAIVGISYPVAPCVDLGIEYRYLHPDANFVDHAAVLSLKKQF